MVSEPIPNWILGFEKIIVNCPALAVGGKKCDGFLTPELIGFVKMCQPLMQRLDSNRYGIEFDSASSLKQFFTANDQTRIDAFLNSFEWCFCIEIWLEDLQCQIESVNCGAFN